MSAATGTIAELWPRRRQWDAGSIKARAMHNQPKSELTPHPDFPSVNATAIPIWRRK